MGTTVVDLITQDFADRAHTAARVSADAGALSDLDAVDVVIDFSLPPATAALVEHAESIRNPPAIVCGTTGLDDDVRRRLTALGERTKILYATNFSTGVAALGSIVGHAAPILEELGYTPVVTEVHHRHKLDAPSGTAKTLIDALAPDAPETVQVHSVRAGEVIGKHDIVFYGPDDQIVIGHEARDRGLFARGAVEAALWLAAQPERTGYFTMAAYFEARFLR